MHAFGRTCRAGVLPLGLAAATLACLPGGESAPYTSPNGEPLPVRVTQDLTYESPGSSRNQLDVYVPVGGDEPPTVTILYMHGGGWRAGDKRDTAELCRRLAEAGHPTVTCNYTFSTLSSPGYPQAIHDVKAVVRWIRTEGQGRGLPARIIAMGDSAGGYLAQMLGTTAGESRFEPLPAPPGGYRIDGVISFYGPSDLFALAVRGADSLATLQFLGATPLDAIDLYREASPINYITQDDPPLALFHGLIDLTVPFEIAVLMRDAFRDICRFCRLVLQPNADHGFFGFGGDEGVSRLAIDLIPDLLADDGRADLNGDGTLDVSDRDVFVQILLQRTPFDGSDFTCNPLRADMNGDEAVDGDDIAALAGDWIKSRS